MPIYSGNTSTVFKKEKSSTDFGTATKAYLTCGVAGETVAANWAALTNTGKFSITINGTACVDVNPDFTGDVSMTDVGASIQSPLAIALPGTTVTWDTDHFVITGPAYGEAATITVLSAPGGGVDLAAAGYMNGKVGTGVVTDGTNGKVTLFTINGGKIKIKDIIGEVTTIIQAQTTNVRLISNPTVGADVDLCTDLDTNADAVGTMYHISGVLGDALIATTSGAFVAQQYSTIVAEGVIELSSDNLSTGKTKWIINYEPIDFGAYVS